MFIARWSADVRFGHKSEFLTRIRSWNKEIGEPLGWRTRVLVGAIGAGESRIESEFQVETLADLEAAWQTIGSNPAHAAFGKEIEPYIVSGSNRWDVYRIDEG